MSTGMNRADKSIKLRVAEARSRDVGRKIARVDRETMKKLGIEVGDFVEVIGPKGREVLKIWPAYPEDEGQGLIRVDGTVRKTIGVSPGDYVTIRPIKVEPATRIIVAPAENMPRINADPEYFAQIIKKYLQGNPVKRGDVIDIPFYGMLLRFVITSVQPSAIV
ncbi:MAG: AAA family ATPase, partial [Desulfurococcaceae archaeon]